MNILLVIEGSYPWFRTGLSEWTYQYLKHFKNCTFHVLQISSGATRELSFDAALYPLNENIKTFKRLPVPPLTSEGLPDLNRWFKAMNISELKVDRIHVVNTGFAGWLGAKISEKTSIPLVLTEHTLYWKEIEAGAPVLESGMVLPVNMPRASWVEFFKAMARVVYAQASVVIGSAQSSITEQRQLGAFNPVYIPNGVASTKIVRNDKKRSKPPVIGWVGRCADVKNPLRFLDLVECFKVNEVDARFIMVICDANEPKLEHAIKERLKTLHRVEVHWNRTAEGIYEKMDAICITSNEESQPLVLIEAAAKRVVPFGWRAGDFDSNWGLVVSQQDIADALIQHWVKFWRNETGFLARQNELLDRIMRYHTWEHIFAQYDELLKQAAQPAILAVAGNE